jgi:hypothetical protein
MELEEKKHLKYNKKALFFTFQDFWHLNDLHNFRKMLFRDFLSLLQPIKILPDKILHHSIATF